MKTLLIRLEGPMQSWGYTSRFTERDTGLEPSKSGVLGLICAALGKPREEKSDDIFPSLSLLGNLRMGVRVDRPGKMGVDFQTVGGGKLGGRPYGVAKANNQTPEPVISRRYFLQDASFLVGLESDNVELLRNIHSALLKPVWPLYLGRKSYIPGRHVYLEDGLQDRGLEDAFSIYPVDNETFSPAKQLLVILDNPNGREHRIDVPIDFAKRKFGVRYVSIYPFTLNTQGGSG